MLDKSSYHIKMTLQHRHFILPRISAALIGLGVGLFISAFLVNIDGNRERQRCIDITRETQATVVKYIVRYNNSLSVDEIERRFGEAQLKIAINIKSAQLSAMCSFGGLLMSCRRGEMKLGTSQ